MKRWKQVLSLGLSVVLLLSVMVTGAGAAFADQSQISHKRAVDRCVQLKILGGYGDGTFRPKNSLTRAEACKILCVTLSGGSSPTLPLPATPAFRDVRNDPNSAWAENYITFCCNKGIVGGVGGGRFEPSQNLTGTQLAKMLLTAMGYDAVRSGFTGVNWEYNVKQYAQQAGLFASLSSLNQSVPLSREAAAQMIVNALDAHPGLYGGKPAPEALYSEVLRQHQAAVDQNQFGYDQQWGYVRCGWVFTTRDTTFYYAFRDIDGNGTDELFIGAREPGKNIQVVDLFCYNGVQPVHLFPPSNLFGLRENQSTVYADGTILTALAANDGSMLSVWSKISPDGYTPQELSNYAALWHADYDADNAWTYHENVTYQCALSGREAFYTISLSPASLTLSEETFRQLAQGKDGVYGPEMSFAWTAF